MGSSGRSPSAPSSFLPGASLLGPPGGALLECNSPQSQRVGQLLGNRYWDFLTIGTRVLRVQNCVRQCGPSTSRKSVSLGFLLCLPWKTFSSPRSWITMVPTWENGRCPRYCGFFAQIPSRVDCSFLSVYLTGIDGNLTDSGENGQVPGTSVSACLHDCIFRSAIVSGTLLNRGK